MLKAAFYKYKRLILLYIIMGIIGAICNVLGIVYFQKLIDVLSQNMFIDFGADIIKPLVLYAIFMVSSCVISYLDNYPSAQLENSLYYYFKNQALKKIETILYNKYQDLGTGKIIQIVENGASAGVNILFNFIIELFYNLVPGLLCSLVVLGVYNKEIMVIIGIGYIFVFIISNTMLKKLYKIQEKVLVESETISDRFVRSLMEVSVFRINRKYKKEIGEINKNAKEIVQSETKVTMIHEFFFAAFFLIIILIKIIIIIIGINQKIDSIGEIVALVLLIDNIYNPISEFNVMFVKYKLDHVAFKRFSDFMKIPEDTNLHNGLLGIVPNDIVLKNVSVEINNNSILSSINAELSMGKKYAVIGESGSGKSTFVKTLLGVIKVDRGEVLINGININEINLDNLYKYISYVSQIAPIFNGTIKENLVFDNETITDEEIYRVLEKVCLKDKVKSLPKGLLTKVGEKGSKISGGERQKIALARVILQKSPITILDEATSSLDYKSEEIILKNLFSELRDSLIIIIDHRLKSLPYIEEVYFFEKGKIVESGSPNDLQKIQGKFYELWKKVIIKQ